MTEAEKAQFYATILAGILAGAFDFDTLDKKLHDERVVRYAITMGDELRAQLLDKGGPPF